MRCGHFRFFSHSGNSQVVLSVLCYLMGFGVGISQVDFSKTTVERIDGFGNVTVFEKVRPMTVNGRTIHWRGRFAASIGPDGILLVDNGFEQIADTMMDAMRRLSRAPIRLIINTHWHQDHAGANHVMGRGVPIIAHEYTRRQMMDEKRYHNGYTIPAAPVNAWPNITFTDSLFIYFNGEEIQLYHFSDGHTMGDIIVYFTKSKMLCMGDTYNGHFFPRIAGNIIKYIDNYKKLIQRIPPDVKVVSGHRPIGMATDLKEYLRMLVETSSFIKQHMIAGKTLNDIKALGLPGAWESWNRIDVFNALASEAWIEIVYDSLSKYGMGEN